MAIDLHEMVRENVDAWALGALDADDTRTLEAHLLECDACASLAGAAQADAASLALAVPLVAAPVELKVRVMASASVLRELPAARRFGGPTRWWNAAAAAIVVAGIGVMAWGAVTQRRVSDLQSDKDRLVVAATSQTNQLGTVHAEVSMASAQSVALGNQQDAMLDIVSQPDVKRIQLEGTSAQPQATGRYVWSSSTKLGVLVARDLPALAEGEKYCLWLVYEDAWVSGGLFDVDATGTGRLVVRDRDDGTPRGAFKGFAVTVEHAADGGATHTGPTMMQANVN